MSPPNGPGNGVVRAGGRTFSLSIIRFENGCFASVTEGGEKLGSLTVSLYNRSVPVTTEVIPSGSGSIFMRLAAESLATKMDGIAILSVNVRPDLTPEMAKEIMAGLAEMVS